MNTKTDTAYTDKAREMAAEFLAFADEHAAHIMTSDLLTENFARATQHARHMVKGGSYSGGDRQRVFTQLRKLQRYFA